GDVVVDLGAGSGVLALLAARAGARRVYAVECDGDVAARARAAFAASPFAPQLSGPLVGDARTLDLPEPVDVIVGAMLHAWLLGEAEAPAVRNAARFLKPGGRVVPGRVESFATLCQAHVLQPGCPLLGPFHLWPDEPGTPVPLGDPAPAHTLDLATLTTLD